MKLIFLLVIMTALPTWAAAGNKVEFFNKVTQNGKATPYVGVLELDFASNRVAVKIYKDCGPLTTENVTSAPCLNYLNEVASYTTPFRVTSSNGVTTYSGFRYLITPVSDNTYISVSYVDNSAVGELSEAFATTSKDESARSTGYHLKN